MSRWCAKVEVMTFGTTCSRQKDAIVPISLNQPLTTADDLPDNLSYN
jgi:predicted RNA-binding protein with PUA domain